MYSYLDLLRDILNRGEEHEDRTGVNTLSLFGYQWRHHLPDGFPLLTTKRLPFRWIAEELFWFLSGSTNEADLRAKGVDIWKEWATAEHCAKFGREPGDLGPVYGEMWMLFPVGSRITKKETGSPSIAWEDTGESYINQIDLLVQELKEIPNSRRHIVTAWHPYWSRRVTLPACHTLFQCKVHPKKGDGPQGLSLHLYARSSDSFLGLPFNIASYALLLSLLAKTCGYTPQDLIISFGDLHLYSNHFTQAQTQLQRIPRTLPKLTILQQREHLWDYVWEDLLLENYHPDTAIPAPVAV